MTTMMLQTVLKMVLFPLCVTCYVSLNALAESPPAIVESPPSMQQEVTAPDVPLPPPSNDENTDNLPVELDLSDEATEPMQPNDLVVEMPVATPQTTAETTLQLSETLEESMQKISVMGKVLNALGPEVDETLRNAALNVAEADKTNDKELYRQAVQTFETLYEKQFGATKKHTSVQGLAESLKKVEVMSRVIEAIGPKGNIELREAAKQVFEADNAGDEKAYQQAVETFESLYQAAEAAKAKP
jgi:hypothetical protein